MKEELENNLENLHDEKVKLERKLTIIKEKVKTLKKKGEETKKKR